VKFLIGKRKKDSTIFFIRGLIVIIFFILLH